MEYETLKLTQEWDKTFPKSDKVDHRKVTFHDRFGITLAADLYQPKGGTGRLAAIAVCGPFGAVKEQASGLYAQTLAERGFLTMAFDPSYTGESGGQLLLRVDGEGWYQEEGKPARSLKPGDVVTIPANVKHWHGAKAGSWFSHLAVEVPGQNCSNEWCEPVSDEEYGRL